MEAESTVSVRAFRAADREQVEQLWRGCFPDDPPSNAPAVLIDTKLKVQPDLFLIAVADGVVVGAVMAASTGSGAGFITWPSLPTIAAGALPQHLCVRPSPALAAWDARKSTSRFGQRTQTSSPSIASLATAPRIG